MLAAAVGQQTFRAQPARLILRRHQNTAVLPLVQEFHHSTRVKQPPSPVLLVLRNCSRLVRVQLAPSNCRFPQALVHLVRSQTSQSTLVLKEVLLVNSLPSLMLLALTMKHHPLLKTPTLNKDRHLPLDLMALSKHGRQVTYKIQE